VVAVGRAAPPTNTTRSGADRADTPKLRTTSMHSGVGLPGVAHLVTFEVVAAAVALAALSRNVIALAATSFAAIVLVLIVFGRADGRWVYEWFGARRRMGQRRRAAAARIRTHATSQPFAAAMATLSPRLSIRAVPDRGRTIGVGQDRDGWFVALAVGLFHDVSGEREMRLELERLVRLLDESVMAVSAVQVVSHHLVSQAGDSAATRSYRELVAPEGCPLDQRVWLAVRLSPTDAVEAAATRGGGIDGVDRAMAALAGRLEKILASAGATYEVLDADGLRDAILFSCGLETVVHNLGADRPKERWTSWTAGGLVHVCFTVADWPREPSPDLVRQLSQVAGVSVTVATVLRPHGERAGLLGLVRVVAPADRLRATTKELSTTASQLGLRLRRLDGDQATGVYATAPTGGGRI
jgi:type VII secretion protein EccE